MDDESSSEMHCTEPARVDLSTVTAPDFEAFESAWQSEGWDSDYAQLAPGPFSGELLNTRAGEVALSRGTWGGTVRHRGLQPQGTVSLAFTISQRGVGTFEGQKLDVDRVIIQSAGAGFELFGPSRWEAAVFVLPEAYLVRRIAAVSQRDPHALLGRQEVAQLTPHAASRLQAGFRRYFAGLEQNGDACSSAPPFRGQLLDLVSEAIVAVASPLTRAERQPHPTRRRALVAAAEDVAMSACHRPIRMTDLCEAVGASERTLRYAFREVAGDSPVSHLRKLRLNRVHRILRSAEPGGTQVKTTAYENGFRHLGEFAAQYRGLFAECPSETLLRRPQIA